MRLQCLDGELEVAQEEGESLQRASTTFTDFLTDTGGTLEEFPLDWPREVVEFSIRLLREEVELREEDVDLYRGGLHFGDAYGIDVVSQKAVELLRDLICLKGIDPRRLLI